MSKRACSNWLDVFLKWSKPFSEAPDSLLIWSGLFCIASVLKRRVRFSKKLIRLWDVYPSTYLMFVGPPGVVKKSTTSGYAERLILSANSQQAVTSPGYVHLGPSSGSYVKIIEEMTQAIDGSMSVISGEFGNLVSVTPEESYDFFARMFDNPPYYRHATRMHGDEVIVNPSFSLLGCTTPEWIAGNSGYMLGGGFAARTIFVFEYHPRQHKLFDDEILLSEEESKIMEGMLVKDLIQMGRLKGEAVLESKALRDRLENWYVEHMGIPATKNTETFHTRKHVHVLRTAMLLSISMSDDLVVCEGHVDAALDLINDVEKKLSRGLSVVGRNPYSADFYRVKDYVAAHGPIARGKLMADLWTDIPPENMASILEVLKSSGQIEEVDFGNQKMLRVSR